MQTKFAASTARSQLQVEEIVGAAAILFRWKTDRFPVL
jgi:hypothetical protein